MKKTVCIVNFNTPELTRAAILSIRRHGGEGYRFVVFDNSDKMPPMSMGGVEVIDNTKGQIIDFDAELAKYPKRNTGIGCAMGNTFGSVKHMMSVDWLIWNTEEPFVLADSDILVRENIDAYFDETQAAIGKVGTNNPLRVPRLQPMLCWLNSPMLREAGIHYHDGRRSWGLTDSHDDRCNWYDTGAVLLEDVKAKGLPWRDVDTDATTIYHLGSGSWKNDGGAEAWLEQHRSLWDTPPHEAGNDSVAMCAIVRLENDYLREWVGWHQQLGVEKFYIYDNSKAGDERPAEVLGDYIKTGAVEIVPWPRHDSGDRQCPAYDDCYRKHGRDHAWIGFLDIDELVMLKEGNDLKGLLNSQNGRADVVVMHWQMMSDSGHTRYEPRPMHERFTKPAPQRYPEKCHVKSWVRGGIGELSFLDPHCPLRPSGLRVVNPNGTEQQQKSISDKDEKSVAWINHYFTKTAEEFVRKNMRGYPNPQAWTDKRLATACNYFFAWNAMTDEKVAILRELYDNLPNEIKMMEHLTRQSARWGYTRLVADEGYLIRSKETGAVFKEITVPNPMKYETIPLPTSGNAMAAKAKKQQPRGSAAKDGTPALAKDGTPALAPDGTPALAPDGTPALAPRGSAARKKSE